MKQTPYLRLLGFAFLLFAEIRSAWNCSRNDVIGNVLA